MTLLDAREYDPEKERKRKRRIISVAIVVLVVAALGWWFRYWPEERIADHFFEDLQKTGLRSRLRRVDARSAMETTSGSLPEISL